MAIIAQYFIDITEDNKKSNQYNWEIIEFDYPDDLEKINI